MSSGAINFISDSHASRYNFGTLEGMLRDGNGGRPSLEMNGRGAGNKTTLANIAF
jgi:hypothetical protein